MRTRTLTPCVPLALGLLAICGLELAQAQTLAPGLYRIRQQSSGRFVDAHQLASNDHALVTRPARPGDRQLWRIEPLGADLYTIQQASTGRFVDAHERATQDYALVTRPAQTNDSQRWRFDALGDRTYAIRQASSGRFVDAHENDRNDYAVVTRPAQQNATQRWTIEPALEATSTLYDLQGDDEFGYFVVRTSPDESTEAAPGHCRSRDWSDLRAQVVTFVAPDEGTDVAITFSGRLESDDPAGRMEVRALIGRRVAAPSRASLAATNRSDHRSVTFVADGVSGGTHTVRLQCRMASTGGSIRYGDTLLRVVQGTPASGEMAIALLDDSGAPLTSPTWAPLPGAATRLRTDTGDLLSVRLSAEVEGTGELAIRALGDGRALGPSEVLWSTASGIEHRGMTFVGAPAAGSPDPAELAVEYRVVSGSVRLRSGALVVESRPATASDRGRLAAVAIGTRTHTSDRWETLVATRAELPPDAELLAELALPGLRGGAVETRVLIDGLLLGVDDLVSDVNTARDAARNERRWLHGRLGAGDRCDGGVRRDREVKVEWRALGNGAATVEDPFLLVDYEANRWSRNGAYRSWFRPEDEVGPERFIEGDVPGPEVPAIIVFREDFAGRGRAYPTEAQIRDFFERDLGIRDFFERVSEDRFTLNTDNILFFPPDAVDERGRRSADWYTLEDIRQADIPLLDNDNDPDNAIEWIRSGDPEQLDAVDFAYYNRFDDCERIAGGNSPRFGPFHRAGDLARYYAFRVAEQRDGLRLGALDVNGDGVIGRLEALLVNWAGDPNPCGLPNPPHSNGAARAAVRFCGGTPAGAAPFTHDGKTFTDEDRYMHYSAAGPNLQQLARVGTWAHELGHALFGFGDLYTDDVEATAEPGSYALMGQGYGARGNRAAFMSVANRLRLGWMTPALVVRPGAYTLEEAKRGGKALILPRLDCSGQETGEYFALENRRSEGPGAARFDRLLAESAFHIWHYVPDESRDLAPACDDPAWLNLKTDSRQHRFITRGNLCRGARAWPAGAPDLLSAPGAACQPAEDCTQAMPPGVRVLAWADGTPSGYRLTNFRAGPDTQMSVDIATPSCAERRCNDRDPECSCQCDPQCAQRNDCCYDRVRICVG